MSKNDGFCIKNEEFCIKTRNSELKTRNSVFKMMNFAVHTQGSFELLRFPGGDRFYYILYSILLLFECNFALFESILLHCL